MSGLLTRIGRSRKSTEKKDKVRDVKKRAFLINACKFVIDQKYEPIKPIGKGAYGVVCSAKDSTTETKVAIKKITDAFEDLVDAKRILREAKLLQHFDHENVVSLLDMMNPPLEEPFNDVYMVLELMDTDMERIICSNNDLTDHHVQYFIYQLLRGLKYIHSGKVIHRDLKPGNLLLNADCDLKICDFGLARGVKDDVDLTKYVVTRWYRAPELLCSCIDYTAAIDVWSCGCILAELLGRKPLWPGQDYIEQIDMIISNVGSPTDEDLESISNVRANAYLKKLPKKKKIPWEKTFPKANPQAIDLLDKMLLFDPKQRITVEDALRHPYLEELALPETETKCHTQFDFSFEDDLHTKEDIQDHMWEEIFKSRPFLREVKQKMQSAGTLGKGYPKKKKKTEKKDDTEKITKGIHSTRLGSK